MTDINIEGMNLSKLTKPELLAMCEESGIKKCKSKNKEELINLLENKLPEKNKITLIIEDDEEIKNEVITQQQQLEINKIYNEDCVAGMKKIKSESVDIIICDPPYNIGKDFGNDSDKQKMDDYLLWCDSWITECLRILKPQGTLYIYGFSEILAFIRTRINCNVRWLVWHYTNKVLKNAAGKVRKSTVGRFSNGDKETIYTAHEGGALPRDVIKVPALAGGAGKKERVDHPTQKPLTLCDTLIKASLNKSSPTLLVVPFVGSGSECVSAKNNNISFIGFEINSDYINTANERLDDI